VEKEYLKISLCGAENLTLRRVVQKCLKRFEMLCWRRTDKITWNDEMRSEVMLHKVKSKGISYILYVKKKKATWIEHILCKNFLLKQVIEGKIDGRSYRKARKKR
jgi:hypothetical protein